MSNPALDAAFQALPGSSFVVNGAAVPQNSALTSVGAELHLTPRWTVIGKFDGEFASSRADLRRLRHAALSVVRTRAAFTV